MMARSQIFPFAIGGFWCAAPALVEGNTVILKPSEDAPLSSQIATEISEPYVTRIAEQLQIVFNEHDNKFFSMFQA